MTPTSGSSISGAFDASAIRRPLVATSRLPLLLTLRGFALLTFAILLIVGPISTENDIIASILAYSFGSLIIIVPPLTLFQALRLRRQLNIRAYPPGSEEGGDGRIRADRSIRFIFRSSPVQLLPFFVLSLKAEFQQGNLRTSVHRLTGSSDADRVIPEDIRFPHRGLWQIRSIHISLSDQLGLSHINWEMQPAPERASFEIYPPRYDEVYLPVLSSCHKPGDLFVDTQQRLGDPFDLKRYHPADGLKKVVWKIFARTGELISRHPEQSMTPEGQVVVYVVAEPQEDHVCGAAVKYLEYLEELGLNILAGCDGMTDPRPATSHAQAESLFVKSAWRSLADTQLKNVQFDSFLEECRRSLSDGSLSRVFVLVSRDGIRDLEHYRRLVDLGTYLENQNIKPAFGLIEPQKFSGNRADYAEPVRNSAFMAARNWFIATKVEQPAATGGYRERFNKTCFEHSWEIFG